MSLTNCLMPKRIFKIGKMIKKDGTVGDKILYRPYDVEYVYKQNNRWVDVSIRDPHKNDLKLIHKLIEGIVVPCGKCHYCRLQKAYNRSKQAWAEGKYYKYQYFITFTYAPEHLPMQEYCTEDGVIEDTPVLVKDDIRKVKEILRDRARTRGYQPICYMASGEYGEKNGRPHYHMILLTDDPEIELSLYDAGRSATGYNLYGSTVLDEIWANKGLIKLSRASQACMAYTARYTLKKQYKGTEKHDRMEAMGIQQEFITATPGIGKRYLEDHLEEILEKPTIQLPGTKGVSIPKYFIDQIEKKGYKEWVKNLKETNIARQKVCIEDTEKMYNMHYDEYVKHQQFQKTKRQYEM